MGIEKWATKWWRKIDSNTTTNNSPALTPARKKNYIALGILTLTLWKAKHNSAIFSLSEAAIEKHDHKFQCPPPLVKICCSANERQWSEENFGRKKFAYPINIKSGPRRQFECWFAASSRFSHHTYVYILYAAGVLGCWKICENSRLCNFQFSRKQTKFTP